MSVQIGASEQITHKRISYSFTFPIVGFFYLETAEKVGLIAVFALGGMVAGAVGLLSGLAISTVVVFSVKAAMTSLFSFYISYSIACCFIFPNGGRLPPLTWRLITKGPYLPFAFD